MKEMNENQLRGWRPRPASAGLRRRIFHAPSLPLRADWDFSKLAPATFSLLFAVLLLHFNGSEWRENRSSISLSLFNGSNAVAFSDHAQELENHLASVTFDWTNKGAFQSSIGSHFGSKPTTNFSN